MEAAEPQRIQINVDSEGPLCFTLYVAMVTEPGSIEQSWQNASAQWRHLLVGCASFDGGYDVSIKIKHIETWLKKHNKLSRWETYLLNRSLIIFFMNVLHKYATYGCVIFRYLKCRGKIQYSHFGGKALKLLFDLQE